MAMERLQGEAIELSLRLVSDHRIDLRRYNAPTVDEVGTLMVGGDVDEIDTRNIIVRSTNGYFQRVSPLHNAYAPLHNTYAPLGKCKKRYPRSFNEETRCDVDEYPEYRHHQTRIFLDPKTQHVVDNRWIVPYNLHLATKYHVHIKVEICLSVSAVKYLYKYVYKGPDHVITIVKRRADTLGQENNA
jgi:hypothetical protein